MGTALEDLRVLQAAEAIADQLWDAVGDWDAFARDTVGKQLVRAADSTGANIAESFGRFHYGEKINLLYYARGSLFETKYWLNRALSRALLPQESHTALSDQLVAVALQVNAFAAWLKRQRADSQKPDPNRVRDPASSYTAELHEPSSIILSPDDIEHLKSPNP